MKAIISHNISLKELGKSGCPGGGKLMQYDGFIWKPPMKNGLIADPILILVQEGNDGTR